MKRFLFCLLFVSLAYLTTRPVALGRQWSNCFSIIQQVGQKGQ